MRADGRHVLYVVEFRRKGEIHWTTATSSEAFNLFYHDQGESEAAAFKATGVYGTFDDITARKTLEKLRSAPTDWEFQIAKVIITQKTLKMPW